MTRWLSDQTLAHLRALPQDGPADAGRYEFREEIGRGGMGAVFRAYDRELDRDVAVKVLNAAAPGAAARLLQEARILGRLEHPGIVPIHDVGTLGDGRLFYVMKLVRGERLDRHAARASALVEQLGIIDRLCDAVAFAHAHGVIHRDLKPENVMIGAFGEVLVLDWGVAKLRDVAEQRGTVLGTPGYMAPEQAAGEVGAVDERADVYAIGGILAFLLARSTLRDPGSAVRNADRGMRKAEYLHVPADAPRPLAAIVRRARQQRLEERYPSVQALALDVKRFAAGMPIDAYREGAIERTRRLVTRYRTAILLVAAYLAMRVILLLAAGA